MPEAIRRRRIETDEIVLNALEAGAGPPVLLLHGFPELAYSWRHQLPALAAAGFHAIAPDLRGYGASDAPEPVEAYSMRHLLTDMLALLRALDVEYVALVGHDWGANIGWAFAQLYPQRVAALTALGVPYPTRPPRSPTAMLRTRSRGRFNFALHCQAVGVLERELEADVSATLRRFFFALSGDAPPALLDDIFLRSPPSAGVLDRMPDPPCLPGWLTANDLEVYTAAFTGTGFRGPANRYRNLDRDWTELPTVGTARVECPVLFVTGERDPAFRYNSLDPMRAASPHLREIVLFPGCGHWTQQERPREVNDALIGFLRRELHH